MVDSHQSYKHCPRLLLQQGSVYFLERGPLLCVPPPAAQHDLVERVRTQHRLRQVDLRDGQGARTEASRSPVCITRRNNNTHLSFLVPEKLPGVFYHLLVGELRVGLLLAEVQDLPQGHPKGPHVARCGELALRKRHSGEVSAFSARAANISASIRLWSSPGGCSPKTSSVWAAPLGPGCGSSRRCTGFCSCQSLRSLSCSFCPPGNCVWPSLGGQNSKRRGTSSPRLSEQPCNTDY